MTAADLKAFQDSSREAAQHIHMLAATKLAEYAASDGADEEVMLKIYNATKDVAQAVPEKKVDPNANLPVLSITFINGSAQVSVEMPPPAAPGHTPTADVVEMEAAALPPPELDLSTPNFLVPSANMLASTHSNSDLEGLG